MVIGILVGTRPEIIKMSPVIRELEKQKEKYVLMHSNQHYSSEMDKIFFDELKLPKPKHNFNANRTDYYKQVSTIISRTEEVIRKERIGVLLVQGDTNTVLAGAMAARNCGIKIGHVEAGLRSRDLGMPEELNRFLTDHMADLLFVPTKEAEKNLSEEGIPREKIIVTGNTVVDGVQQNINFAKKPGEKSFFLMTLHRAENVDSKEKLAEIIKGVGRVSEKNGKEIIFPVHPRTKARIKEYGISLPKGIKVIRPIGYLEFLGMLSKAELVLTDSGGIQEEACSLNVPCVTLRTTTERPETVKAGANIVAGVEAKGIADAAEKMLSKKKKWQNPFGDGKAAERIVKYTKSSLG